MAKQQSLKIKVDGLSEDNCRKVAYQVIETVKSIAPDSNVSVLGGDSKMFEGSSKSQLKQGE